MLSFNGLIIVGALAAAALLGYVKAKVNDVSRVQVGAVLSPTETSGEPLNFLLVGTDSAESLDPDDPLRADRPDGMRNTDTIMVLRIDPESERVQLVSVPRDLWVDIPGYGSDRVNVAFALGGGELLIRTVQESLGIPIHHYLVVDFGGFIDLVEELGGVSVHLEHPIRDDRIGLLIEQTGCVRLDPRNALSYVRTRDLHELIDGRWEPQDRQAPDLERGKRQQQFLVQALRQAVSRGVRNPVKLNDMVNSTIASVTLDDILTTGDILGLANQFRNFAPENVERYQFVVVPFFAGDKAVLGLDEAASEPVLDLFRGSPRDTVAPSSVRVRVLNGTGENGLGTRVSAELEEPGFDVVGRDNEPGFGATTTVVRYTPGREVAAAVLASWIDGPVDYEASDDISGADVELVVGADYDGVAAQPAELAGPPSATDGEIPGVGGPSGPGPAAPTPMTDSSDVICG